MLGNHGGVNAAAHIEFGAYPHEVGMNGVDEMVKHFVRDGFVEGTFIAE